MSGCGLHRRTFARSETGEDIYTICLRQPTPPHSPSMCSNKSWLPFHAGIGEGMTLPSPYLRDSGYMPYHHIERECPHCIGATGQKRRLEENERMNLTLDNTKARLEEERREELLCEDIPEDMDIDVSMSNMMAELSTHPQNNELMKIGGKRRMDTRDENESPSKKTKCAGPIQDSSPKRKREIECDEENFSKRTKAGRDSWEDMVRWWRSDRAEWCIQ